MLRDDPADAMTLRELLSKLRDFIELFVDTSIVTVRARYLDLRCARFFEYSATLRGIAEIPRLDEPLEHGGHRGVDVTHRNIGPHFGIKRFCKGSLAPLLREVQCRLHPFHPKSIRFRAAPWEGSSSHSRGDPRRGSGDTRVESSSTGVGRPRTFHPKTVDHQVRGAPAPRRRLISSSRLELESRERRRRTSKWNPRADAADGKPRPLNPTFDVTYLRGPPAAGASRSRRKSDRIRSPN